MPFENSHIASTYARFPVVLTDGKGSVLTDEDGKSYIDLGSGIAVNIFGAADDEWSDAVTEQLRRIQHTSNLYYTLPQEKLAELMCEKTGMKRVFFGNSGAEANECMIKAARKYSFDRYGAGRATIVTLKNSFHGRTVTTLAATGQDSFHTLFGPFTEGFVHAAPNDIKDMSEKLADPSVCAVMMELVQGEGGVIALDKEYVAAVVSMAREKDILVLIDEVQTGNGRTGSLYAYMQYGFTPDAFSTAKGLGGGLPIGATAFADSLSEVLTAGTHGSTFGGNPVCAAGAFNVLSRLDDDLLQGVKERSEYIRRELEGAPGVNSVDGLGLMLGIATDKPAKEIANECLKQGVLVLTAKTKVRLLPPLNIPMPLLEKAVSILKGVIAG